ncbi:hypothetical protein [Streptomyces sp. SID8374]|uniref:hypothetical protein n=1 Tax=Streptomyces sp. SID8374 TaxID=2690354 RepID=UPI0019285A58|nr:hypothetical protein [Streptomyces sp. SID8374]
MAGPEVNDRPKYTVEGSPHFMPDKKKPQTTWLLPRQTVSWAVSGSHIFTWEIGAGAEAEAGAILAKAKVSVDADRKKAITVVAPRKGDMSIGRQNS